MEAIVAFAEVLVEGRPLSPPERRAVAEHVDRRTRTDPGYLALYRRSATLLDRLAGTRFAALPFEARTDLTARHGPADSRVRTREYFRPCASPPTLTIVALAIRAAEDIAGELRAAGPPASARAAAG